VLTAEKLFVATPIPVDREGALLEGQALRDWLGYPGDLPGDCPMFTPGQLAAGEGQNAGWEQ